MYMYIYIIQYMYIYIYIIQYMYMYIYIIQHMYMYIIVITPSKDCGIKMSTAHTFCCNWAMTPS